MKQTVSELSSAKQAKSDDLEKKAEALHHIPKHEWDERTISVSLSLEKTSDDWDDRLASWTSDGIRSYYVRYEDMVMGEDRCRDLLSHVISFLQPSLSLEHMPPVNIHSQLLALHSPTCKDRIENYEELAENPKMINSKSISACNMINEYFASLDLNQ